MTNGWSGAIDVPGNLHSTLRRRLGILQRELGAGTGFSPLGLLLVIDETHGGDSTAQELVKRFHLIDKESGNIIDFYYLGWTEVNGSLVFDLNLFEAWRDELKRAGVRRFGGNADLLLVDVEVTPQEYYLHFEGAVSIDLSKRVKVGDFPTLGEFFQALISAAEEVRNSRRRTRTRPVFRISDELGVLFGKESIIDFVLNKFGSFIGAKRLSTIAVRNLGPKVALGEFGALSKSD
jgi:hypothetical protein